MVPLLPCLLLLRQCLLLLLTGCLTLRPVPVCPCTCCRMTPKTARLVGGVMNFFGFKVKPLAQVSAGMGGAWCSNGHDWIAEAAMKAGLEREGPG